MVKISNSNKELVRIENSRFKNDTITSIKKTVVKINKNEAVELVAADFSTSAIDIDSQYTSYTLPLTDSKQIKHTTNTVKNIQNTLDDVAQRKTSKNDLKKEHDLNRIGYWQTVHSIESKQGKLLYRPRNKSRNCTYTRGPCGHHQLTVQALKDIGCNSLQCRKDRLDYNKSLSLSKKLLVLNEKRLKKNGVTELKNYQKYLIHQQGAYGIKSIIAATQGKKELSKKIKRNMANNSPYSYRQLKRMGSKMAANKFMRHWEVKWVNEKRLIISTQVASNDNFIKTVNIPTFSEQDIYYALNMTF